MGKAWSEYMAKNGKQEYEIGDPMTVIDQLRAELAAAKEEADKAGFNLADAKGEIAVLSRKLEDCQAACASHETANKHYYEKLEKALGDGRALAADNERLRKALERSITALVFADTPESKAFHFGDLVAQLRETIAATPAQSLAAHDAEIRAAALREVAKKLNGEGYGANEYYRNWLIAEADRIEKEAPHA